MHVEVKDAQRFDFPNLASEAPVKQITFAHFQKANHKVIDDSKYDFVVGMPKLRSTRN